MIRFGLTTDSHYADRDNHNLRNFRDACLKMEEFIQVMNEKAVDFIIHLGDFKDEGVFKKEENTLKYLRELEDIYSKFKGPTYHCVGNHDIDSITKKMFLEGITNTGIAEDRSFYSFDMNNYHFIVLDANYTIDGVDHYMKDDETNWENPFVPQSELEWLEKDLAQTELPVILFSHHPVFEVYYEKYSMFVKNYLDVLKIVNSSKKVVAAFHGHIHEERHELINGVHYFTSFAMVDYPYPENAYAIVSIDEKGIEINGYGRSSSQVIQF